MKSVYLAGPISGLKFFGATDWREFCVRELAKNGIQGLSPMRGKDYLLSVGTINSGSYDDHALSTQKAIVTRDRLDTTTSDLVIMNLLGAKKVSIGTMIELGWADANRVPVVLVMEKKKNAHEHCMVREMCGFQVETLEEALYISSVILNPTA
jgi:nucleoside 2-deoxyribosyltransferase